MTIHRKHKGAAILIIFPLLFIATLVVSFATKPVVIHNTKELAGYTDCEPEYIRKWLNDYYIYDDKFNSVVDNKHNELTGDECIARKTGNCRCYAAISQDTLNLCKGYSAHTACMLDVDKVTGHCLTFFTDPKGRKGFINSGAQAETFPAKASWGEVAEDVQGTWGTP